CTVNVRDAEIGYWYSLDQYYQIVTFYSKTSGSRLTWDYVTATTTFDLVQSVQDGLVSYEITSAWDPYLNQTTIDFVAITLPMPAAAATTVSSLSEVLPIPTTPLTQENILDDLYTEPPPASVAFTGASSTVFVAASGTPYVAYSSYEVESFEPVTDAYGKVSCRSSVTAYNLSAPYAFEYNGDKLGSSAEASGPIPEGFLQQIPQSTCVAGSYRGPVTIIYIVHVIYGSRYTPFIGHVESSIDQLEVPTLIEGPSSISRPKAHVETTVELEPPKPVSTSHEGSDRFDGSLGLQNGGSGSSPPVIVAGTQTATMDSSSGFVIGDQTLSPGGPAVTVEGTVLSLSPSATAIVINGQASSLFGDPSIGGQQGVPELGKPPIVTIGSIAYTANAATQYYLAPGQTLTAGGVATIQGTVVSLGPSASYVVINGATQTFPSALITPAPNPAFAAGEAPAMVIAGQTLRPGSSIVISGTTIALDSGANNLVVNDGTSFVIGNQILTPGGYIVVDGNTVSLDASDRTIYINGVASSLGNSYPFSTVRPVLTISGTKYVPEVVGNGFEYVIQGQTLSPGGSIVLDGTKTISLAPGATALVVNGIAQGLTPGIVTNLEDIVVGGSTLTGVLGPGKTYIIDGQTLTIGGSVVVDGTVVSFPSESAIVINGVTQTLFGPGILTNAPDLTIAGTVYTDLPGPGTAYVIAGSTLTPGGIITVDGTIISLSPSATTLVVNGVTETLFPATAIPGSTRFPVLTIDGQVYTAVPNSGAAGATYVIGGQTLTLGGSIVVDGTIISLSPSATVLVIDGQTQTLVSASTTQAQASAPSRTSVNVGATASATAAATGAVATGAAGRATNGAISSLFLSGLLVLIGCFLL
ncbi:hypothetical protein B0J12DRAFT_569077, partial [Macrophomina phaseolina]